jgi:hypothetical protein
LIKTLNVRSKAIKLLEERIGEMLYVIGLNKDFGFNLKSTDNKRKYGQI